MDTIVTVAVKLSSYIVVPVARWSDEYVIMSHTLIIGQYFLKEAYLFWKTMCLRAIASPHQFRFIQEIVVRGTVAGPNQGLLRMEWLLQGQGEQTEAWKTSVTGTRLIP